MALISSPAQPGLSQLPIPVRPVPPQVAKSQLILDLRVILIRFHQFFKTIDPFLFHTCVSLSFLYTPSIRPALGPDFQKR